MAGGGIKINNIKIIGGADGKTPVFKIENGKLYNSYNNGVEGSWYEIGQVQGEKGENGIQGERGPQGNDGSKVVSVDYLGSNPYGNIYLMTFSDGMTAEFVAPKGEVEIERWI